LCLGSTLPTSRTAVRDMAVLVGDIAMAVVAALVVRTTEVCRPRDLLCGYCAV
jgi:hypothetical protein